MKQIFFCNEYTVSLREIIGRKIKTILSHGTIFATKAFKLRERWLLFIEKPQGMEAQCSVQMVSHPGNTLQGACFNYKSHFSRNRRVER